MRSQNVARARFRAFLPLPAPETAMFIRSGRRCGKLCAQLAQSRHIPGVGSRHRIVAHLGTCDPDDFRERRRFYARCEEALARLSAADREGALAGLAARIDRPTEAELAWLDAEDKRIAAQMRRVPPWTQLGRSPAAEAGSRRSAD